MHARSILLGAVLALGLLLVAAALGWVRLGPSGPTFTTEGVPILVSGPPPGGMLPVVGCAPEGVAGPVVRDARVGLTIDGYTLVWPYGYTARAEGDVVVLLDADGSVVAREGDTIRVDGGFPDEAGNFTVCGEPVVLPAASAGTSATATPAPTPPTECPAALLEGVLAMDPHGGLGIAAETGEVQPVRWPPTFSTRVTGDVVVLFGETEAEVARTGDRVSVGGGMTPEGDEWVVCPWEVTRSDR